jgi:WD repeat-containing protein 35
MRNDKDEMPVLIETVMTVQQCKWSPDGSMFAVAGAAKDSNELKAVVQFYSNAGNHLKTLRVP